MSEPLAEYFYWIKFRHEPHPLFGTGSWLFYFRKQ